MAVLEADTTQESVGLCPYHQYRVTHLAVDSNGNAATNTIFLGDTAAFDASHAPDSPKLALKSGESILLPARIETLYFITAAGTPVFNIAPERYAGNW